MSLIDFVANLDRASSALERIADALDRAIPPAFPPSTTQPYKAGIGDIIDTSPEAVQARNQEAADFAIRNHTIPNSEAFRAKVMEYEKIIIEHYGEDAAKELPWNK